MVWRSYRRGFEIAVGFRREVGRDRPGRCLPSDFFGASIFFWLWRGSDGESDF
jgi:hypothetical protein